MWKFVSREHFEFNGLIAQEEVAFYYYYYLFILKSVCVLILQDAEVA